MTALLLQNNLVEAQTEQRCSGLAMLCQSFSLEGIRPWHPGKASYPIVGGTSIKPGSRMQSDLLFSFALDTSASASAKQEGSP